MTGEAMRVIFMGTPEFSVPVLDALVAAGHEIAAVYCQPPRPAGRGKKDRPTPVQARAEALGLAGAPSGVAERRRTSRRNLPRWTPMSRWWWPMG